MTKPTKEKMREYQQRYLAKPDTPEKRRKLNRDWIAANREAYNEAKTRYRLKLKIAALEHYSGGKPSCRYCGYAENIDALCLDHIDNNGADHRKELGCSSRSRVSGTTIYERLKAKGWMPGLQVLCFNCNTIKELERKRSGKTSHEAIADLQTKRGWKRQT